eukprot:766248-Hanusia_phi.AAC.5
MHTSQTCAGLLEYEGSKRPVVTSVQRDRTLHGLDAAVQVKKLASLVLPVCCQYASSVPKCISLLARTVPASVTLSRVEFATKSHSRLSTVSFSMPEIFNVEPNVIPSVYFCRVKCKNEGHGKQCRVDAIKHPQIAGTKQMKHVVRQRRTTVRGTVLHTATRPSGLAAHTHPSPVTTCNLKHMRPRTWMDDDALRKGGKASGAKQLMMALSFVLVSPM